MTNIPSWGGTAASALLVAVTIAAAAWAHLGLSRDIVIAAVRAGVQLVAVGAVLLVLFRTGGAAGALGWVAAMIAVAALVAGRRGRGIPRSVPIAAAGIAIGTTVTLGSLLALAVIPARPEVIVPVGGMIVSTAMQASALTMLRLAEQAGDDREQIETRLLLGCTATEAFAAHRRRAARTALVPAIDSAKVVGLISLPGAMTGLILAGVDPLTAIRYQIVVMYMLLAATILAALTSATLTERTLFDHAHRLRIPEGPSARRRAQPL
jgi:putative ABC transport system permease protein